jgi:hypothetical protein
MANVRVSADPGTWEPGYTLTKQRTPRTTNHEPVIERVRRAALASSKIIYLTLAKCA